MYQEKKRERRRRDFLRMKERARRIQKRWWQVNITEESCSKLANNIKICSCYMCGNPRKWWDEITIQEKRAIIDAKEQYNETPECQ